jgi:hypothetical protein
MKLKGMHNFWENTKIINVYELNDSHNEENRKPISLINVISRILGIRIAG